MKSQECFIGLAGLGYWGKNILRNLHEMGAICLAFDTDTKCISQRKEQFPDIEYTTSLDDILSNQKIRAVAIASPAVTHYEIAKKSLLAGKDVFIEKPLSLTGQRRRRTCSDCLWTQRGFSWSDIFSSIILLS